jgi:bifunctional enzyme CysN/CysC
MKATSPVAVAGEAITITLCDDVDVTRGDVIANTQQQPGVADQFEATIIWMAEQPMLRGRSYLMRIGGKTVPATVAPLKYKLSIETIERIAATSSR